MIRREMNMDVPCELFIHFQLNFYDWLLLYWENFPGFEKCWKIEIIINVLLSLILHQTLSLFDKLDLSA